MGSVGSSVVSIVVPIYHGSQYISRLIAMAEMCKKEAGSFVKLELVLSNDDPDNRIEENLFSDTVDILVLNTRENRGIQGARIRGIEAAQGEYIVFLDQDDMVHSKYIKSQLHQIGNADAIVCRCIHEGRQFYNADMRFEEVITKEYMMTKGNPIISAGQVMVRRKSIPEVWLANIMKTNCADDYLLWLCMTAQDAVFVLNQEVLFEHTVHGENLSLDYRRMVLSLEEMYDILSKNKVFGPQGLKKISDMRQNALFDWIALLEKFREMFIVLDQMMKCREEGHSFGKHLQDMGICRVAVYGDGYIGKRLMGELKEYNIETVFFIDRNADYLTEEVPVYRLEDAPANIDAVVISLVQNCITVRNEIKRKYKTEVYTIKEILQRQR